MSTTRHQETTSTCPLCHGVADVTATGDPHIFAWECRRCPTHGTVAWATKHAPPTFTPAPRTLLETLKGQPG